MGYKNTLAKLHNKVVEAIYDIRFGGAFTADEHKIFTEAVCKLNVEDDELKEVEIDIKEFLIDINSKENYRYVKEVAERLVSKHIGIEIRQGNNEIFGFFNIFSHITHQKGSGKLRIAFNPNIRELLIKLKGDFTKIPKKEVYKLASSYSIKLYQMLKRFEDTGVRVDEVYKLRQKLGVEDYEYKRFPDFERWVLKKAVDDINRKTDIEVSYEKIREGRRIKQIKFIIKQKEGYTTEEAITPSENLDTQREKLSIPNPVEERWKPIAKIRKEYQAILDELVPKLKRLNENQVLFLLANLDTNLFPIDIAKEIIITADKNKNLNNPMGFLIKALHIDTNNTQYKELTLTPEKIDEKLLKKAVIKKFGNDIEANEKAKAILRPAWRKLKPELDENSVKLLLPVMKEAIYDDFEEMIYLPAADEVYKDWLEYNILDKLKELTGVDIEVVLVDLEKV